MREKQRMIALYVLATAYCLSGVTATGTTTEYGVAAVDPAIIPLGSRFRLHGQTFRAEDTGLYVKGRHVDFYFRDCDEARRYGVRRVRIEVLAKR